MPPKPIGPYLRDFWQLQSGVTFLNPRVRSARSPNPSPTSPTVGDSAIEAEPIEMLGRQWPKLVANAKAPVAEFLNADPDGSAFITNATEGVNCVLRSLDLDSGG